MVVSKENIQAAKKLVIKYRKATNNAMQETVKHLYSKNKVGYQIAEQLFGFGSSHSCTLCIKTQDEKENRDCSKCIYGGRFHCLKKSNKYKTFSTYKAICDAKTLTQFVKAILNRALLIEKILKNNKLGKFPF